MVCLVDCAAKLIVVVFSIILSLLALVVMGGAIYALTDNVTREFVNSGFMIGVIVVSVIFFLIGILGCRSASKGRNLIAALIFLLVVLLGIICFSIMSAVINKYTNSTNSFLETGAFSIPFRDRSIYNKIQDRTYTTLFDNFNNLFEASECSSCTANGRLGGLPSFGEITCGQERVKKILDEIAKTPSDRLEYVSYEACRVSVVGEQILATKVSTSTSALQLIDAGLDSATFTQNVQALACWCRSNRSIFDELKGAGRTLLGIVYGLIAVLCLVWVSAVILRIPRKD